MLDVALCAGSAKKRLPDQSRRTVRWGAAGPDSTRTAQLLVDSIRLTYKKCQYLVQLVFVKVLCQFLCFLPKIRSNGLKQEIKAAICLYSADKNIEIAENPPPQSGAAGKRRPSGCSGARDCQKPCRKGGGEKARLLRSAHKETLPQNLAKTGCWLRCRRLASKKDAGVPARCLRPAFALLLLRSFAACCSASAGRAALFVPDGALHFGRFAVYLF